ncbi:trypsin-like peptidase domain-containing protein [Geodermatophilus sp. URMC 61]|uniref:trypsin-like peptidase domain-containing protein n=1 Tax=Geodermatophilus sp. URMC 61 TaxID=3423411 RepID=UPI00406BF94C
MTTPPLHHHPVPRRLRRLAQRAAAVTAAVLVAATATLGSTAAATDEATPAPSPTADPLPSVTPEGRASDLVAPATAFVRVDWSANVSFDGETWEPVTWTTGCSAVVVDSDGLLVTAGHCVDDSWDESGARREAVDYLIQDYVAAGVLTETQGAEILNEVVTGAWEWRVRGSLPDSPPDRRVYVTFGGGPAPWTSDPAAAPSGVEANVLAVKSASQGDVGLIKIQATNLPVAELAPEAEVQVGQEVVAIGYPLDLAYPGQSGGLALTNRQGIIESVNTEGQHSAANQFYATSATPSPGMSGGPVSNLQGQVVGLSSTVVKEATHFIVPSSLVLENFGDRIDNTPGRVDELYRQGLTAYYAGQYSDAISNFEQVLLLVPDLPSVADKKVDAAQRREQFGDQQRPADTTTQRAPTTPFSASTIAIGGGLAAVVLGLTTVGLVLRRRRRRREQENASPAPDLVPSHGTATPDDPAPADADVGSEADPAPAAADVGSESDANPDGHSSEWDVPSVDTANGRPVNRGETAAAALHLAPGSVVTRSAGQFCRSCGTRHEPDDAFCSQCGAGLRRSE